VKPTKKNPHAVALGRLGGLVGGKVTGKESQAKADASRVNAEKARKKANALRAKTKSKVKEFRGERVETISRIITAIRRSHKNRKGEPVSRQYAHQLLKDNGLEWGRKILEQYPEEK